LRNYQTLCLSRIFTLTPLNTKLNPICHLLALLAAHHIIHVSRIRVNPLNTKLNPICHLLALLAAHHIIHASRIRVNPLNTKLNPICHLLALLANHHILHVSRIRVNPLYAKLNPICHLLALLAAHHILHISGLRVKTTYISLFCSLDQISVTNQSRVSSIFILFLSSTSSQRHLASLKSKLYIYLNVLRFQKSESPQRLCFIHTVNIS
jgi:transposase